jgi:lipopolysaccharide heptosyltransferase II
MCLPALEALKKARPQLHLTLALPGHLCELFSAAKDVDATIPVTPGSRAILALASKLRSEKFDSALLLPNSFGSALGLWLARIPQRAGYARDGRSWMLTRAISCDTDRRRLHQIDYYLALLSELGAPLNFDRSKCLGLAAPDAARKQVREVLAAERQRPQAPLFVLAPCAIGGDKEWPGENFGRLAALLFAAGNEVVLTGAANEKDKTALIASIAEKHGAEVINLVGRNSVAQMAALFETADGYIGNDSGPMHLAGALGLPALGVFINTDPELYRPLGPRASFIGGIKAMPQPQEVLEKILSMTSSENKKAGDND